MEENKGINEFNKSLEALNEYQRAAVTDRSRVLLVNAHVGSGKTTVLISKVLYLHLVKGVPLESMAVLTFTNKAAAEIKSRLREANPSISDEAMRFFGTFHSVARVLLSTVLPVERLGYTKEFSIADTDEILEIYDRVINENELSVKYRNKLRRRIEQYRQGKLLYGTMKHDDDLVQFMELFEAEKLKCNIMEFDDLLNNSVRLLGEDEFCPQWIIVDEFQDCDSVQLEMIEKMAKDRANIFAVGDPNQIIYTWRGSRRDIFEGFKNRHAANELSLPVNYRSTTTILHAAGAFLGGGQTIQGVREKGNLIIVKKHHNSFNEAIYLCDRIRRLHEEGVPYSQIAVFYRKQKQSEVFRDVFEKHGIPYEVSAKRTLKDIPVLYWLFRLLKASVNPSDRDSLAYVLRDNMYGLGLDSKKIRQLLKADSPLGTEQANNGALELTDKVRGFLDWCGSLQNKLTLDPEAIFDYFDLGLYLTPTSINYEEDRKNVVGFLEEIKNYIEYRQIDLYNGIKEFVNNSSLYGSQILREGISGDADSVKLMTLHASKGLEFKYVFISGANLGLIPVPNRSPEEDEEEKRLFFVGITRARDYLEISYHANPEDFGVLGVPSPFLRMIPPELIESEELGSRAATLAQLRREVKTNIDNKAIDSKAAESAVQESEGQKPARVWHDKYGQGSVVAEDENNITVVFEVYGEKVFSKLFCPLKYL